MPENDLNDYQLRAAASDLVAPTCGRLWYYGLGIAGEAGEVADKIKKLYRDGTMGPEIPASSLPEAVKRAVALELGDVLWYVAAIARMLGVSLSEVAEMNNEKLAGRMRRGTVFGAGDVR